MARQRYSLSGRSVLVTGAARGIGAECASQIAARGGRVALVGLEPDELERAAAACGPEAIWFEADVRDANSLSRAIDGTLRQFGGLDVAIANAGVGAGSLVRYSGPEALDLVMEINLLGAARTLRLCLPHVLERRGYLLATASVAAIGHPPGMAAYSASKAGLEAFADSLRIEVRHLGVDVGVAYFSWIDTEMVRGADRRRELGTLRDELKGPLARRYPPSAAARAVVRGIERRGRWVTVPNWLRAPLVLRSLMQFGAEAIVGDRIAEFEQESIEEMKRLEGDPAAPVGAGGEAASRATSHD